MIKLKLDSGFVRTAINLLTNDTLMNHTVHNNGRYILINPSDLERTDKILERNMIPYKVA